MKKLTFAFTVLLYTVIQQAIAQNLIEVTFNKTSSIIFPSPISAVDRGSKDVLAQKVKGIENVLQLKAGRIRFKDTNLTVITTDGKLHQFTVRYADIPKTLTVHPEEASSNSNKVFFEENLTTTQLEKNALSILHSERIRPIKTISRNQIKLSLLGIYIQDNMMFYHLKVSNDSNIPYHTDLLRFYVRDKQQAKRIASQEVAEVPIFQKGNTSLIKGKSSEDIVFALPKFTIPDAKLLIIEITEKRGGRNLKLNVKNKAIIKARLIRPA